MALNFLNATRRAFCCCRSGGGTSILAALAGAGAIVGVSLYETATASSDTAIPTPYVSNAAVYGAWDGNASGATLPPDGLPFSMTLEDDGEGGISGEIEAGDGTVFQIVNGSYDEEEALFNCWVVNSENPDEAAEMNGYVDGDSMSGSIVAGEEFEAEFEATRGG